MATRQVNRQSTPEERRLLQVRSKYRAESKFGRLLDGEGVEGDDAFSLEDFLQTYITENQMLWSLTLSLASSAERLRWRLSALEGRVRA